MAKVNWTIEAVSWLEQIQDYIAKDNPSAAYKTVLGIYEKVETLSQFPFIGYPHKTSEGREIRILLFGHYRIAYLIKADSSIDVLGVFHGSLDINRFL